MEYIDYNRALAQRFVNDYRLPIPIINKDIFFHHLFNYEKDMQSWTKWCKTVDIINNKYDSVSDFLDDFYTVRDKVIHDTITTDAYMKFNTMDMNKYKVDGNKYKSNSNGIYNERNIGKNLISIDLTKANYQALKYVDDNIVFNTCTYEDYIRKFTDNEYIINSKYFRQVIFGQMNPSRHISIEKYMIYKILDQLTGEGKYDVNIICINSDEIVIEDDGSFIPELFVSAISRNYGFKIHVEKFTLDGYNLLSNNDNHHRCTFYVKNGELMCVPGPYYAIVHKLYNDEEPSEKDYHFNYENIDCIFNDTFRIEKIEKK